MFCPRSKSSKNRALRDLADTEFAAHPRLPWTILLRGSAAAGESTPTVGRRADKSSDSSLERSCSPDTRVVRSKSSQWYSRDLSPKV